MSTGTRIAQARKKQNLTQEQFKAERLYLVSLFVAKSMFREGIISEEEYEEIDTILLEKYRPVLGTLLAGKPLSLIPI